MPERERSELMDDAAGQGRSKTSHVTRPLYPVSSCLTFNFRNTLHHLHQFYTCQLIMPIKNSLQRLSLPQAIESLKNGTGASTTLPASVRAVSLNYVYKRAGRGVE